MSVATRDFSVISHYFIDLYFKNKKINTETIDRSFINSRDIAVKLHNSHKTKVRININ